MNFSPILPTKLVPGYTIMDRKWYLNLPSEWTIGVVGLGDVGSTLVQALCVLGSSKISEIKIFDLDPNRLNRFVLEFNQMLGPFCKPIPVTAADQDSVFRADMVVFTASKSVPSVGKKHIDMRMVQFEANAQLVENFIKISVAQNFRGLYAIVSDPVDLLCQVARDTLNKCGILEGVNFRIKGFGLGVMNARANFYAKKLGFTDFEQYGRVYGPHGKDLIVVNHLEGAFNPHISQQLRELTINANLEVRALGFKPFIAPAVSSAAYSIKACIEGLWHYSTIPFGQQYFGCLNAFKEEPMMEQFPVNPVVEEWINATLGAMERDYATLPSV